MIRKCLVFQTELLVYRRYVLAFSCFLNVPSNHTMMSLYSIYVCFLLNNSKSSGIVRYFFDDDGFFYVVGIFGDYVFSGQSVCLKMVEFPLVWSGFTSGWGVDKAGAIRILSAWWFGTWLLYFPYIGNSNPSWLICFIGAETTNQLWCLRHFETIGTGLLGMSGATPQ